jgi:hypothetical protein
MQIQAWRTARMTCTIFEEWIPEDNECPQRMLQSWTSGVSASEHDFSYAANGSGCDWGSEAPLLEAAWWKDAAAHQGKPWHQEPQQLQTVSAGCSFLRFNQCSSDKQLFQETWVFRSSEWRGLNVLPSKTELMIKMLPQVKANMFLCLKLKLIKKLGVCVVNSCVHISSFAGATWYLQMSIECCG